jgi:hypothetical protein
MGGAHYLQGFTKIFLDTLRRRGTTDRVGMNVGLDGKRLNIDAQYVAESLG